MAKHSTKVVRQAALPRDAYTPPNKRKEYANPNAARYLVTDYDKPLDPMSDEHTDFLLALYWSANQLRGKAMKWLDDIDWSGNTGEQSEADIEERFRKAEQCDSEARLLLNEYRRGVRREWIANFPRKGPQYRPEVYAGWKRRERQEKAKARKEARS